MLLLKGTLAMKKKFLFLLLTLTAFTPLQIAHAKDTGKALHDTKCLACHDSEAYTRKERIVKSLNGLSKRVTVCTKQAAKANWDKNQIDSVVEFLNTRYYKF